MFKIITKKNDRVNTLCKYTLQFAICTKNIVLFELYLKKKVTNFCLSYFLLRTDV